MKKFVFAALAVLLLAGCVTKPIQNVENHPIPTGTQPLSLDKIESLIIAAGYPRGWQFKREAPGHLVASQVQPKFSATVDIRFDQHAYSITHRSSTGLREEDGMIHTRYNHWIQILQRDIDQRLINEAMAVR
jgi:hypothetical protein